MASDFRKIVSRLVYPLATLTPLFVESSEVENKDSGKQSYSVTYKWLLQEDAWLKLSKLVSYHDE